MISAMDVSFRPFVPNSFMAELIIVVFDFSFFASRLLSLISKKITCLKNEYRSFFILYYNIDWTFSQMIRSNFHSYFEEVFA